MCSTLSLGHLLAQWCATWVHTSTSTHNLHEYVCIYIHTLISFLIVEFPPYWQPQPMERGQEKPCHLFNVPSNTEEYKYAIQEFRETMFGLEFSIISLERIQNINEYTKHCAFLDVLKRRHGDEVLLKRLFHGTSTHSIQAIAHQGFNRIFAADANGN